jgi:hypothetical protein
MLINRKKLRWMLDCAIPECRPVKDFFHDWRVHGLYTALLQFEKAGIRNQGGWERALDYIQETTMFRLKSGSPEGTSVDGTISVNENSYPVKVVRDSAGHLDIYSESDIPDGHAHVVVEGSEYNTRLVRGRFINK